jgi:hypothetical protein
METFCRGDVLYVRLKSHGGDRQINSEKTKIRSIQCLSASALKLTVPVKCFNVIKRIIGALEHPI